MKKLVCILLALSIFTAMVCGCASQKPEEKPIEDSTLENKNSAAQEDLIAAEEPENESITAFRNALSFVPLYSDYSISDNGKAGLDIIVADNDVANFGLKIYEALEAANNNFEDYTLDISLAFDNGNDAKTQIVFVGTSSMGIISDYRADPNNAKETYIYSMEELAEYFPAVKERLLIADSGITADEQKMYDEVWDVLDTDPRDEDVIFAELGPKYGMTGSELEAWIMDMMEKIY